MNIVLTDKEGLFDSIGYGPYSAIEIINPTTLRVWAYEKGEVVSRELPIDFDRFFAQIIP